MGPDRAAGKRGALAERIIGSADFGGFFAARAGRGLYLAVINDVPTDLAGIFLSPRALSDPTFIHYEPIDSGE